MDSMNQRITQIELNLTAKLAAARTDNSKYFQQIVVRTRCKLNSTQK